MQLRHPCKYCLTRPICRNKCYILKDYAEKIDIIDNDKILITICCIGVLILSSLFASMFIFYPWCIIATPFVWGGSYWLTEYLLEEKIWDSGRMKETIFAIVVVPAMVFISIVIILKERYLNKYGPTKL